MCLRKLGNPLIENKKDKKILKFILNIKIYFMVKLLTTASKFADSLANSLALAVNVRK